MAWLKQLISHITQNDGVKFFFGKCVLRNADYLLQLMKQQIDQTTSYRWAITSVSGLGKQKSRAVKQ